ncbi:MAG TPA: hypothetical protein VFS21_30030 [Roseiflexaceae bacterium]|nr:hypothetical protein [Roseiflexaceae bacterium]
MKRGYIVLIGLLVIVLAGCGGTSSQEASSPQATPTIASLTPVEVHQQWIDAVRSNDRQAASALLVPELRPNLDRVLAYFTTMQQPSERGALTQLDVGEPTAAGVGMVAASTWVWPRVTECYRTSLAEVDGRWMVSYWESTPCPRS